MSRNELIKKIIEKLAADNKINSLVSDKRVDTWKITGRKTELKVEWQAQYATKFYAPPGEVLNALIAGLKARPHT